VPTNLRSELRIRAERTADTMMAEARAQADRIQAEGDRQIEETRQRVLTKKDRELQAEAHAKVAAARHAAMREVLVAKAKVVNRVLGQARTRLPEAARSRAYRSALERELADAVAFVGERGGVVQCSEELAPTVREVVRDLPNVSVQTGLEAGSGFRIEGAGKSVIVDGTLETKLDRLASTLAIEIHKRLEDI
jgi:vacuolar-type H+-ATPase subunit E/Vma4